MNSKLSALLGFATGVTAGGAVVWYYAKEKYARIAQEEIDSVKEVYAKREKKVSNDIPVETPAAPENETVRDEEAIKTYTRKLQDAGYTDYSSTVVPSKSEAVPEEFRADAPYVIPPYEFGELDKYAQISLTYYADGVLADEDGEEIDNIEEIVGDALSHFGEYEEDSVYVRNDAKRCDYEILKDSGKGG